MTATLVDPVVYGQNRDLPDPANAKRVTIPVLTVEGMRTADGRLIRTGALAHRPLPQPLFALTYTSEGGHLGAEVIGRIDHLERVPGPEVINIDTGQPFPEGTYVWRSNEAYLSRTADAYPLIRDGFLTGVSADLFDEQFEVEMAAIGGRDAIDFTSARLGGATVCPVPAFAGAHIVFADSEPTVEELPVHTPALVAAYLPPVGLGDAPPRPGPAFRCASLGDACAPCAATPLTPVRAALEVTGPPVYPPAEWFAPPAFDGPTPITVTPEGRVFGHLATWDVCHRGLPQCTTAPRSPSGYAQFALGSLLCADGSEVHVGKITMDTGHAGLHLSSDDAMAHYDHTGTTVAYVAAGEDDHGVWLAGALAPGVSDEQTQLLRASPLSGDWRPVDGRLELVAALAVNTSGFPVLRAGYDRGEPLSLVASAWAPPAAADRQHFYLVPQEGDPSPDKVRAALRDLSAQVPPPSAVQITPTDLAARLTALEQARRADQARALLPELAVPPVAVHTVLRELGAEPAQLARNDIWDWLKTGGGARRIRWGTAGSWTRCHQMLRDEPGMTDEKARRICAEAHKQVTGKWPAEGDD